MVDGVGVRVPGAGYDTISLLSRLLGVNIGHVAKTQQESPIFLSNIFIFSPI